MLMVEGEKACDQLLTTIYRQNWNPLASNINGNKYKKKPNSSSKPDAAGKQQASTAAGARENSHHGDDNDDAEKRHPAVDVAVFNKADYRHRFGVRRKAPAPTKNLTTIELNNQQQQHHVVATERDKTMIELRKRLNLVSPPPIISLPPHQQRHHAAAGPLIRSSLASLCLEGSTPPLQRPRSRGASTTKRPVPAAVSAEVAPAPFLSSMLQIHGQSLAKRKCCVCKADDHRKCECLKLAVRKDDDDDDDVLISDDNESLYTEEDEESDLSEDTDSEWEDVDRMRKLYADANKSTAPHEDYDDDDSTAGDTDDDTAPIPYQFADALTPDYDRYVKEFPVRSRRGSRRLRERLPVSDDYHQEAIVGRLLRLKRLQHYTKQGEAIQRQRRLITRVQSARTAPEHRAPPPPQRPSTQGSPTGPVQRLNDRRLEWADKAAQAGNLVELAMRHNDLTILDRNWTVARGRHVRRRIEARFQSLRQSTFDVDERRALRHKEKRRIRIALSKLYNYSWSERVVTSSRHSLTGEYRARSARSARGKKPSPVKAKAGAEPPPKKYPHEAPKSTATRKLSSAPGGRRRKSGHKRTKGRRKASLC